jgi:hypothetical protein
VLFASSHADPNAQDEQRTELERRRTGDRRRRRWVYDEFYDIYVGNIDGTGLANVTNTLGYDAEGSFSPDGTLIAFSSNRRAYAGELAAAERDMLEKQPENFCDVYIMKADGTEVRRLTEELGDDGGPFFSPDGKRICWRHFSEDGVRAEIWTMNIDGSDQKQITRLGAMSWAPFFHPSGKYLIFGTNRHGFGNFELYIVDAEGRKEPVRVTYADRFDGLPVFSPDGNRLAWTSNRTENGEGQIFFADWRHAEAMAQLGLNDGAGEKEACDTRRDAVPVRTVREISGADIHTHVTNLAAVLTEGQGTRADGPERVAEYVACAFNNLGLEPAGAGATLFQTCELPLMEHGGTVGPRQRVGCNVLARMRARQPVDDSVLVVGTHVGYLEDGVTAADHVSGVAGVLEIAEYLSATGDRKPGLARDVVFAVFLGEELTPGFVSAGVGLGHKLEAAPPPAYAAYIGLGQIGQMERSAVASGVGSSPVWRREIERRNVPVGLRLSMLEAVDPRSPAIHFYAGGVPVLHVSAGEAASTAGGTGKSDYDGAAKVARLAGLIAQSLAASASRPSYAAIRTHERGAGGPYLGTVPNPVGSKWRGVQLMDVKKGGPAEQAGLRKGDVIIELNGNPVGNIEEYARILDGVAVGAKVPVVVQRDGERHVMTIRVEARK